MVPGTTGNLRRKARGIRRRSVRNSRTVRNSRLGARAEVVVFFLKGGGHAEDKLLRCVAVSSNPPGHLGGNPRPDLWR